MKTVDLYPHGSTSCQQNDKLAVITEWYEYISRGIKAERASVANELISALKGELEAVESRLKFETKAREKLLADNERYRQLLDEAGIKY